MKAIYYFLVVLIHLLYLNFIKLFGTKGLSTAIKTYLINEIKNKFNNFLALKKKEMNNATDSIQTQENLKKYLAKIANETSSLNEDLQNIIDNYFLLLTKEDQIEIANFYSQESSFLAENLAVLYLNYFNYENTLSALVKSVSDETKYE